MLLKIIKKEGIAIIKERYSYKKKGIHTTVFILFFTILIAINYLKYNLILKNKRPLNSKNKQFTQAF